MSSLTSNSASAQDVAKKQVSTAEFVLTAAALAVGSSTSPTSVGKEGEAMIAEQVTELLQDKTMVLEELNHLYCYRFGSTIAAALKSFGFEGSVQDYIGQHKRFSMKDGSVSVIAASAAQEQALQEDCGKVSEVETASIVATESTADIDSCFSDTESDVDITGWHSVGTRLADAMDADVDGIGWQFAGVHLADELSPGTDGCASNVDVSAWQSVGSRLAATLAQPDDGDVAKIDVRGWQMVGNRFLAALDSERGVLSDIDVVAWKAAACRVAAGIRAADDEGNDVAEVDVIGWHTVGTRLLAAFASDRDDFCDTDMETWKATTSRSAADLQAIDDEEGADSVARRDVGSSLLSVRGQNDTDGVDDIDVAGWRAAGTRVLLRLKAADCDGL